MDSTQFNKIDIRDYNQIMNYPGSDLDQETLEMVEDVFCQYLDITFENRDLSEEGVEDVMQLQNFFPDLVGKGIGEGTWIRVNTEIGYNLYYAKPSNKRMSFETLQRDINNIVIKMRENESVDDLDKNLALITKKLEIAKEAHIASLAMAMPSKIKYVKALRTKSQWMYLLPHEYEIVYDIQLYVNAILDKDVKKSVKYRQLFTKQDHDQVFYMQSRGIPKETAIMMCRLQQCYFIVDTQALFAEWMRPA